MLGIHVFSLQKNNENEVDSFFVYMTLDEISIEETIKQCGIFYDYKIDQCVETVMTDDFSEVDHVVKLYMSRYGIDNVRGGTYSAKILPDYMLKTLVEEMKYMQSGPLHSMFLSEELYSYSKYLAKNYSDWKLPENIKIEQEKIEAGLQKYNKELEFYRSHRYFSKSGKNYIIDDTILTDIQWLEDLIVTKYSTLGSTTLKPLYGCSTARIQKYNDIIVRLKRITEIYFSIRETIDYSQLCNLRNPEFIFDRFICHFNKNQLHDNQWEDLCKIFTFMFYCVKNHLDCLEFDVNSHGEYVEELYEIKMRYLTMQHPTLTW